MGKLVSVAQAGFKLPHAVQRDGTVLTLPAGYMPQLRNPDGSLNHLANFFLLHMREEGASNFSEFGTLRTCADLMAPFLRWCSGQSLDAIDISDNDFRLFMLHLKTEKSAVSPSGLKRQLPQAGRIGRIVLKFLQYAETLFCERKILAPNGPVQAVWRVKVRRGEDGQDRREVYLSHPAVPDDVASRRRRLFSDDAVYRLAVANNRRGCSRFLRERAKTLIWVLDMTGGRIDEVAAILVKDTELAFSEGFLVLKTVKRSSGPTTRKIPVHKAEVQQVRAYVRMFHPAGVAALTSDAPLFTDARGKPLSKKTLSKEISKLRRAAGIKDEEVVAHAFRHRFLTRKLAQIYAEYRCEDKEGLKKLLLSDEKIKAEMMEWSGQTTVEAFDRYIHLEFGKNGKFGVDFPAVVRLAGSTNAVTVGFNEVLALMEDGDEQAALERLAEMPDVVAMTARAKKMSKGEGTK